MQDFAKATAGLEGISSSAYRGGLTYGTTTEPHWLSSLYYDGLPLLLAATTAIMSLDHSSNDSHEVNGRSAACVLGILLASLQGGVGSSFLNFVQAGLSSGRRKGREEGIYGEGARIHHGIL